MNLLKRACERWPIVGFCYLLASVAWTWVCAVWFAAALLILVYTVKNPAVVDDAFTPPKWTPSATGLGFFLWGMVFVMSLNLMFLGDEYWERAWAYHRMEEKSVPVKAKWTGKPILSPRLKH
jgi:hypothetical protein